MANKGHPDYVKLRQVAEIVSGQTDACTRITIPNHATAERVTGGWFVEARVWVSNRELEPPPDGE